MDHRRLGALAVVQTETPGTLVVGVEVTDGAGCTGSDAVILTLDDCTTALEDLGQVFHLNVFPNPFVDDIQVDLPESHAGGTPQLRDLSGREVPCVWTVQGMSCRTHVEVPPGCTSCQSLQAWKPFAWSNNKPQARHLAMR